MSSEKKVSGEAWMLVGLVIGAVIVAAVNVVAFRVNWIIGVVAAGLSLAAAVVIWRTR